MTKKSQIIGWITVITGTILFHALFQKPGLYQQWIAPGLFILSGIMCLIIWCKEELLKPYRQSKS